MLFSPCGCWVSACDSSVCGQSRQNHEQPKASVGIEVVSIGKLSRQKILWEIIFTYTIEIKGFAVINHHLLRERKLPIVCSRAGMKRDFLERAAQMTGKFRAELSGCLGKAIIVLPTPCLIDTVNTPSGTMAVDYAVFPRTHTFVKETDDRIVLCHIGFPRHFHTLRLGKAAAVFDDGLDHTRLIDDSFSLGVHLEQLVLLVLGDGVEAVDSHDAVIDPLPIVPIRDFLEGFEFFHGQETHVGTSAP